jgi:hypothetical protein
MKADNSLGTVLSLIAIFFTLQVSDTSLSLRLHLIMYCVTVSEGWKHKPQMVGE